MWSREQEAGSRAWERGAGGAKGQGVVEASEERVLQASYNTSIDQPALGIIKNRSDNVVSGPSVRSGEASGPPVRPDLPVAIGPTQIMVQSRFQTPNLTRSTDASPRLGLGKQRKEADGSPPPSGHLLSSQHSPTYDSSRSHETPPNNSSSTRIVHHSLSRAKKKHPPVLTSANLEGPEPCVQSLQGR